jgi:haloalkane dehalogenase
MLRRAEKMSVHFPVAADLYPFEPHWHQQDGVRMHYVDEGSGQPILLLHGNPTWSFLYRDIIKGLRGSFRCLAPDYPGFGLSDRPQRDYGYTPREHAAMVSGLVDSLALDSFIVMGQDWGGPIGMSVALRDPERVRGLVFANTWYWPADNFSFKGFSLVMSSPPMQRAILRNNFFVERIMPRSVARPLAPEVFEHYRRAQPAPEVRRGVAVFPREIRRSKTWLAGLADQAPTRLADKPMLVIWGLKDAAFGSRKDVRARWGRDFPNAEVLEIGDAGHYIQEDAPAEIVAAIQRKFGREPG